MIQRLAKRYLCFLVGLLWLGLTPTLVDAQSPGLEYTLILNGTTYEVYMRPNFTPAAGTRALTGQVTIKVPHNVTNPFRINNLINPLAGVTWSLSSRIDAPSEDRNADYLSFTANFSDNATLLAGRTANQAFKIFTFQNTGACTGVVTLMANSDRFNQLPNSAGTNPGNTLQVLGTNVNGEIYTGNYTTISADCTKSDLALTLGKPSPSLQMGVTSGLPVNVTNSGAAPSGPATVIVPLPLGISVLANFTSNGWNCVKKSSRVTCTNQSPSHPSTSSPFTIPLTPGTAAVGTTPTLNGSVSTTNDNNPANDNAPPITLIAPVAGSPDLTIAASVPAPSLKDGIISQLSVVVTNVGSAPTSGPITSVIQLSPGLTTPASFTNNQWNCVTNGTTVTCNNPGPLANGASSAFSVPMTPLASTVSSTPLPAITCNIATPGDPVPGNNNCKPVLLGPVTGTPDLTISLSQPTPMLKEGITSNLPVAVSNLGSAPTSNPITVLLPLPANVNVPDNFSPRSGWNCMRTANTVTCTKPDPLANDATHTLNVPVTPNASAIGLSLTFHASVNTTGEANTNNNNATPVTTPPVLSGVVLLPIKLLLSGAYNQSAGLMRDDLRALNLIPITSPYPNAPAATTADVLAVTGNNAIVDWVLVELRDPNAPATIVANKAALLQRDGDVVAEDGVSPLGFPPIFTNQHYSIAVKHRNHLGAMTASPITLANPPVLLDFTSPSIALYGVNAEKTLGGVLGLWSGDANSDHTVIDAGPGNDVNQILTKILVDPANINLSANYIVAGYLVTDVNLDGKTIAAGPNNDVNSILSNIFTHPSNTNLATNYIVREQLP